MKNNKLKWAIYIIICAVILPIVCVLFAPSEKVLATDEFDVYSQASEIRLVSGDFVGTQVYSSEDALDMLDNFKDTFGFTSSREALKLNKCVQSITGNVYRFDQYDNGYKVYGGELNVSVDSYGRVTSIIGTYYLDLNYYIDVNYTLDQAREVVKEAYEDAEIEDLEMAIVKTDETGYIAYIFNVSTKSNTYKVFVSARTLKLTRLISTSSSLRDSLPTSNYSVENVSTIQTNYNGEQVTLNVDKYTSLIKNEYFYVLGDGERNIYVTDGQNASNYTYKYVDSYNEDASFTDPVAVQAYEYIMKCYDFYADSSNFGISIQGLKNPNGKAIKLIAIVHFDMNYENAAFYLPTSSSTLGYFIFGDGNANYSTGSFVQGLDVVGHEYQHAITDSVVELEYQNASGALAEAFSDIFGAVIEGHDIAEADFWRMGEDIYLTNNYFRDMSNPAATGCTYSYNSMYPFSTAPSDSNDQGGVHYNCTLMTYATYIMYTRDTEFFTTNTILKLWYQTLTHLTTTADFEDFALAMIASANELGFSEEKIKDIEYSFAAVNIPGYTGVETWNGNSLTIFQGSGTIASPYLITSEADLASLAYYVNNNESDGAYATARYRLTADLNLANEAWIAIGTSEYPFNGIFNGGGYTINGLNLEGQEADYAGLFGYAGTSAYIYDLFIGEGSAYISNLYAGAIVGKLQGAISDCGSALTIIGATNVGGLVGLLENHDGGQKVTNCYTTGDLGGLASVGGLVGEFVTIKNTDTDCFISGYISGCYATGTLTGQVVGGLVGKANGLILLNSITLVEIKALNSTSKLGGLVGELSFLSETDTVNNYVANYIISCRSVAIFNSEYSGVKIGLAVAVINGEANQGKVYFSNVIVKSMGNYGLYASVASGIDIKQENTSLSTDNAFEGDFDFDSEKYYKNTSNWTILEGNEAFDLVTTYEITGTNQMPTISNSSEFWLDYASDGFSGGDGSVSNPYQISTAEELALLANLLISDYYYNSYSTKSYVLTNDIDLAGKIWVGIGLSRITVIEGVTQSVTLKAFRGNFDGNGHTIYNMEAVGAYSVSAINSKGTSYYLYEFSPSLFGTTCVYFNQTTMYTPTIKDVTLENVNSRGSYASGVVSKAYFAVNLENVTVMGGNITSTGISAGLVAKIDGTGESISGVEAVSNIKNCYTLVNISGNVAGGAVGYATNASTTNGSSLYIINYLNRGNISVTGIDCDSEYSAGSYAYYRATAGSVIGIVLVRNLCIINSINMGKVVAYNENPMIGGFIGAVGVGDSYSGSQINIEIDGCKQLGEVYYIFDSATSSSGSVIGATHSALSASVTVTVSATTYTKQSETAIYDNSKVTGVTLTNNMQVSEDALGEGDFDVYSQDYYTNPTYFNANYYWTENETSRLYFTVIFKDYDGTILYQVSLKEGETLSVPDITPTRESTVAYDYTFSGWSEDLTSVSRSMSVYAEYNAVIRSYTVNYYDLDGNLISTRVLEYGSPVNQDIEAPAKEGNFFFNYTFLRWGSDGQTVSGDMDINPVYKANLTGSAIAIIFFASIIVFGVIVTIASKKKI